MFLEDRIARLEVTVDGILADISLLLPPRNSEPKKEQTTHVDTGFSASIPAVLTKENNQENLNKLREYLANEFGKTAPEFSPSALDLRYSSYLDMVIRSEKDFDQMMKGYLVKVEDGHILWSGHWVERPDTPGIKRPTLSTHYIKMVNASRNYTSLMDIRSYLWAKKHRVMWDTRREKIQRVCTNENCVNPEHHVLISFHYLPVVLNLLETGNIDIVFGNVEKSPRKDSGTTDIEKSKLDFLNKSGARNRRNRKVKNNG